MGKKEHLLVTVAIGVGQHFRGNEKTPRGSNPCSINQQGTIGFSNLDQIDSLTL